VLRLDRGLSSGHGLARAPARPTRVSLEPASSVLYDERKGPPICSCVKDCCHGHRREGVLFIADGSIVAPVGSHKNKRRGEDAFVGQGMLERGPLQRPTFDGVSGGLPPARGNAKLASAEGASKSERCPGAKLRPWLTLLDANRNSCAASMGPTTVVYRGVFDGLEAIRDARLRL